MKISIGICASNEAENIGSLLENLVDQQFSLGYELLEIIIVSSGSKDATDNIVRRMCKKDERIRLILEEERRGKVSALNRILLEAKGDLLFIISADVYPVKGALMRLAESITGKIGGADCGVGLLNPDGNVVDVISKFLWGMRNRLRKSELNNLAGDMFVIRTGIMNKIPEDIVNDDAYIALTLRRKGWKTIYIPDILVYIMAPRTVMDYLRQRQRIIWGHKQLKKKIGIEPATWSSEIKKHPFHSLDILAEELTFTKPKDYPKLLVGLFLEAIANIIAYIHKNDTGRYIKWSRIKSTKKIKIGDPDDLYLS